MKTLAVKLNNSAERMVNKKHPWVFETGIKNIKSGGEVGDLVIVFNSKTNKFLACGLYDPDSPIKIKLLQFHESAKIDKTWFEKKISAAFALREPLLKTKTNAYRLIFGENDGLPSLIADVYANVLVLKLYSAIWFPYLEILLDELQTVSKADCVVLRLSRNIENAAQSKGFKNGQILRGQLRNEEVIFEEHGILFKANVIKGHKTGFFLDHRNNRKRVGELSNDKKVLDVFSYAGGFSVHALAGGAKEVTSIDISGKALAIAKKNAKLNEHSGEHITIAEDAFLALNTLIHERKRFDIVIIDPPSFAKQQSEINGALRSYERLTKLGLKLVKSNGILLMASCSARIKANEYFALLESVLQASGKKYKLLNKTFHDIDHPIGFPEGAYLKAAYYKMG